MLIASAFCCNCCFIYQLSPIIYHQEYILKAVILCGGKGSRIQEVNELIPKPMLPIGGKPIIWHIMKLYAQAGITEFILCLGYKGNIIRDFFLRYYPVMADCTVKLGDPGSIEFHDILPELGWKVTLADTGQDTMTGGRLWQIRKYLKGEEHFCFTYGDGLADVDIADLVEHHQKSGLASTITAVRVAGRFGELDINNDRVTTFNEKPAISAGSINGGFAVLDNKRIWDFFDEREDLVMEQDVFSRLVQAGQLGVHHHDGFWQCMDTPREFELLNSLWNSKNPPWKTWTD